MNRDVGSLAGMAPFNFGNEALAYCGVEEVAESHGRRVGRLPYAVRVLVENLHRHRLWAEGSLVSGADIAAMVCWESNRGFGVPLHVERVILPDSSGLPVLQDLAALRDAVARHGGDPADVRPQVPVDLVVDHSLQVDRAGSPTAMEHNVALEFARNVERYRFLKWAKSAFGSLRVFPPGSGIVHQVHLEFIASVVLRGKRGGMGWAYPDFVLGGDSHTPMVNGIGVLGWGVGGIDAEAAMLGHAYVFPIPEVVGVHLVGALAPVTMTTDLALFVTERLRQENVVSAMVEFFGPGVAGLSIPERATIANMAPEYGATCGFFPVDSRTIDYLRLTRTDSAQADFVESYCRANHLLREGTRDVPRYDRMIELDLTCVERSVAGPRRPQERLRLRDVAADFRARLDRPLAEGGFGAAPKKNDVSVKSGAGSATVSHGSVVIAAIASCTNTSNPSVMLAAGLLARNAVARGLRTAPWVKTSFAPGSRVVTRYLQKAGLLAPLESLGFHVVGYGCTTCGGKSGPLDEAIAGAIEGEGLVVASVLSGNRNFEGRIHRLVRANYICSPPLVVAFALAGRVDIDLSAEPVARTEEGAPVYLDDLWPVSDEVARLGNVAEDPALFADVYGRKSSETRLWEELDAPSGLRFPWDGNSTYLVIPPFFDPAPEAGRLGALPDRLIGARALAAFGNSVTTDHISPSGEIPVASPAGRFLISRGVAPADFNTYVARRGNHEVMARATFANIRIRNLLVPEEEGGLTRQFPTGERMSIFDAAAAYRSEGIPIIVLAGKDYGMGSSRDWAAKGPALLGVRAVMAESFERIHRANLVGMGIVPLQFHQGEGWRQLGLLGAERYDIENLSGGILRGEPVKVTAQCNGSSVRFAGTAQILTESERRVMLRGGLMPSVLARFLPDTHTTEIYTRGDDEP
jgi:aconitate hydratase